MYGLLHLSLTSKSRPVVCAEAYTNLRAIFNASLILLLIFLTFFLVYHVRPSKGAINLVTQRTPIAIAKAMPYEFVFITKRLAPFLLFLGRSHVTIPEELTDFRFLVHPIASIFRELYDLRTS
jgi:hypothetical protein